MSRRSKKGKNQGPSDGNSRPKGPGNSSGQSRGQNNGTNHNGTNHNGTNNNQGTDPRRPPSQPQGRTRDTNHRSDRNTEPRIIAAERPQLNGKGVTPVMSVLTPRRQMYKKQMHQKNNSPNLKAYGLIFFETLQAAKADLNKLRETAANFAQLNIVIRAEASMDDPELTSIGKVFAGAAWTLIHERRKLDGWYDSEHE
ncbi:MAG: hypothetical protein NTV34_06375 [Proteobacteria bacterium]|nr:hypothetical protein [Pseudomonadota bacterium]